MTLVGKIFVVLVLIMSFVFMAFSVMVYATHRNWRDLVTNPNTGLRNNLANARQDAEQARAETLRVREVLASERAARSEALAIAQTRTQSLREALADREREYNALVSEQRQSIELVKSTICSAAKRIRDSIPKGFSWTTSSR